MRVRALTERERQVADDLANLDDAALEVWATSTHCDPEVNAGVVYVHVVSRRRRADLPRAIARMR